MRPALSRNQVPSAIIAAESAIRDVDGLRSLVFANPPYVLAQNASHCSMASTPLRLIVSSVGDIGSDVPLRTAVP
jgi:hypothetical protein